MAVRFVDTRNAVRILDSGGVLLMDTDTLPGLHCRADRPEAIARIQALKGRDAGKPLLVLAGSVEQAGRVTGALDGRQRSLAKACWPGPFSIILPAAEDLDAGVTGGGTTVAVRVPAAADLRELVLAAGCPLVSTSANAAGEAPAADIGEAAARFSGAVDGLWRRENSAESAAEEAAEAARPKPSAVVDAVTWPPRLLRDGPLPLPALDEQS